MAIPYSHPVLTLHTRHLKDDLALLSTFVHEEYHWYETAHPQEVIQFWTTDHYRGIYKLVLDHEADIGPVLERHRLFPPL